MEIDRLVAQMGRSPEDRAAWAHFFPRYFGDLLEQWEDEQKKFELSKKKIAKWHADAKDIQHEAISRTTGSGLGAPRLRARQLVWILEIYHDALEEFSVVAKSGKFTKYLEMIEEECCVWHHV